MLLPVFDQKVLPYQQRDTSPALDGAEYLQACLRTSNSRDPGYYLHGLVGESAELLEAPADKFLNELGDTLWYYTMFVYMVERVYKYDLLPIYPNEQLDPTYMYVYEAPGLHKDTASALALMLTAGRISECYKKMAGHNKNQHVQLGRELRSFYYQLAGIAALRSVALSVAAAENVDKLNLRYPNGFSFTDSARRADEGK